MSNQRETLSTRDFNVHLNSFDGGGDVIDLTPQNVKCLKGEHEAEEADTNPALNIFGVTCDKCGISGQSHNDPALSADHYFTRYRRVAEALVCKHCRCLYAEK